KETADYLAGKIRTEVEPKTLLFTGESLHSVRQDVIANFDARAFRPKDDYRILVTTEVLAEGVNLHRSNTVINYDIPWNPTRLIQRVGRVNRVDTKFDVIRTYNFFPTEQSNDVIKLKEAAEAKIQVFIADETPPSAREIDFLSAAKSVRCEPNAHLASVGSDFYQLLDRNKEAFVNATIEENEVETAHSSRDNSAKLLRRLRATDIR